jgi:heparan-alpha-glucosaminide N-acetyltransferase
MQPVPTASPPAASPPAPRLVSLDAYRGFVMLLMASDGLAFSKVAEHFPSSGFWHFLGYQTEHAKWAGCTLWDLIQPSFMFMVGVALPFSLSSRRAKGQKPLPMILHTLWRGFFLAWLGIFLRSTHHLQANYTFEDVLTQIGLGYPILVLLAFTGPRTQLLAALGILVAYWAAFALFPVPSADFDYASVGVPATWPHLHGFAAHWDKNTNFAAWADQWFLNLFPRAKPFVFNDGGYLTLNFVPSLATMLFGLLAGQWIRSEAPAIAKARGLVVTGVAALLLGLLLDWLGLCPIVKRIWSPSWAIFSTGWVCLILAFFYHTIDVREIKGWAFPLVVVGMNSIVMYCMDHLIDGFIIESFKIHLGRNIFTFLGEAYAETFELVALLFVLWLICYWLYRRRIFIRI